MDKKKVTRTKGVSCSGYIDCIVKAGESGIITAPLSIKLRRLADLRNSLIHRYWIINDDDPVKSQKSRRSRAGGSPELLDLPGFPLSRE